MFLKVFIVLLSVWLLFSLADNDVEQLFKDTKIIPDVLHTAPKEFLKVEFEDGLLVGDGLDFSPTQTKDAPTLDWSADSDKFYTVYMASPDAPDPKSPTWSECLHWLVVNIPGKDVDKGDVRCPYYGPMSPKTVGKMRYVFLVYEQPGELEFDEPVLTNGILAGHPNFKVEKFAEKYQMGLPLAGNIYRSQYDDYVPIIYKNLGINMEAVLSSN